MTGLKQTKARPANALAVKSGAYLAETGRFVPRFRVFNELAGWFGNAKFRESRTRP
jgi:hypothetical protein